MRRRHAPSGRWPPCVTRAGAVPGILRELAERDDVRPRLRELWNDKDGERGKRMRVGLALLPWEPDSVREALADWMLAADNPAEVLLVRDALAPHKDTLRDKLWAIVACPKRTRNRNEFERPRRWRSTTRKVTSGRSAVPAWSMTLCWKTPFSWTMERGVSAREKLVPGTVDRRLPRSATRGAAERTLATNVLADFAAGQPQVLAALLLDADEKQFTVIYAKLKDRGGRILDVLTNEIDCKRLPDATADAKEKLAKRQANAAVALLKMNHPGKVWPLLAHRPDPRVRSYLINRLHLLVINPQAIVKRLGEEPDLTIRRALLLSLGDFDAKGLPPAARQVLVSQLRNLYRRGTDSGLHAAAEWLLRRWKQETWLKETNEAWAKNRPQREKRLENIQQTLAKDKEKTPPQWYVNGQGQTMVVIPGPMEFVMGSPTAEVGREDDEPQHKRRIGRTFALAAKLVTVEQYRKFDKGYQLPAVSTRMAYLPVVEIDWYKAAKYCNWLSKQEGIPRDQWCYLPKDEGALIVATGIGMASFAPNRLLAGWMAHKWLSPDKDAYAEGMKLAPDYLKRTGYRLPSEAEWEYACRAKAVTAYSFGETEELLPKYAWYAPNSQDRTWPVGSLKPNDFGLFDMHGNVYTWCSEINNAYPQAKGCNDDRENGLVVVGTLSRCLRGGSFNLQASFVRSADRRDYVPASRNGYFGFRVTRTLLLVPLPALPLAPGGVENEKMKRAGGYERG